MRHEHMIERNLMAQLEDDLSSMASADSLSIGRFVETCEQFCRHLLGHMQKEDGLLFRIAEELLTERDKIELLNSLTSNLDIPLEKYERLSEELESTWAV